MCTDLLANARERLLAEKVKVVTKIQLMEKQEFSRRLREIVPSVGENISRDDVIHATTVMALEEIDLAPSACTRQVVRSSGLPEY